MRDPARFVLGTLLVSAGGAAISLSTFNYRPFVAAAGVLTFAAAYSVMRKSGNLRELVDLHAGYAKGLTSYRMLYFFLMVAGSVSIGHGLVIGAKATQSMALSGMIGCGFLVLTGLLVTHESYLRGFLE